MPDLFRRLRSFILVGLALMWQGGIFLDSLLNVPSFVLIAGVGITFLCLVLLYRDPQSRTVLLLVGCMLVGAWRYSSVLSYNDARAVSHFISSTSVNLQGFVADEPGLRGRSRVLVIEVTAISQNNSVSWTSIHGKVEVQTPGTDIEDSYGANYGDNVEVQGKLQVTSIYTSPGISASMMFPRIHVTSTGGNPVIAFLYAMRVRCATIILQALPQPAASLLIAIVLSLHTQGLTPLRPAFNVTGTAHLIAPSGFKVTILAGMVSNATSWLYRVHLPGERGKKSRYWRGWLVTVLVLLSIATYTILSGAGPAAIRAGIMGALLVLAPRIGRQYNVYTALGLSSVLMSSIDPFVLWDTGFLLSFLGTLGIVLLTPYFQSWLHVLNTLPFGHVVCEMIAVTMAAQVATLPIFAITFQQISFIAPLANLLTVPLLSIFIVLGTMICGVGLVSLQLAQVCAWVAWPLLTYVSNCVLWCAALPGAYLHVVAISNGPAWAYYVLLTYATGILLHRRLEIQERAQQYQPVARNSRHTWRIIQLSAACLFIVVTGAATIAPRRVGQLSVTFLDVGPVGKLPEGEAIFIRTPENKTVLIDGGMDATSLSQALDSRLPYWQRSLDMVILTSPRNDHLAGLQDTITRYNIGSIWDAGMLHPSTTYARWRRTISERGFHYATVSSGETIPLETTITLQVLWPGSELHKGSDEVRDNSLILRLVAPGLRVLLLGAAAQSSYAINALTEHTSSSLLQADIVQIVGEKGLAPELETVMQKAEPALVVVTPEELAQKKVSFSTSDAQSQPFLIHEKIVQTGQVGSVEVRSSPGGWDIETGDGA